MLILDFVDLVVKVLLITSAQLKDTSDPNNNFHENDFDGGIKNGCSVLTLHADVIDSHDDETAAWNDVGQREKVERFENNGRVESAIE